MSSPARGHIKVALTAMRTAKWRSVLTMLGIIIGVVSVVTVVSIGEGIKQQVHGQISQLGQSLITVRSGQLIHRNDSGAISGVQLFTGLNTKSAGVLTTDDLRVVQNTKGVERAVPLGIITGQPSAEGVSLPSGSVIASTGELPSILHQSIAYGDFFDSEDVNQQPNVAVIGSNVAQEFYHDSIPLGRSFSFMGQTFIVRGVFQQFDSAPFSLNTDFNNSIFIPYQTAETLTNNNINIYEVLAKPASAKNTDAVAEQISDNLKKAHSGQQHFTVLPQDQSLTVTTNILDSLTRMIVGVAAVSLLVGGIGIMDVMLVSVAERMHEIGIRKAVGATNHQILMQFMTESIMLSLAGGIVGIIVSFLIEFGLRSFTNLTPVITWQVVVLAILVSLLVGIIFGTAPALKAARRDPIDALRNE